MSHWNNEPQPFGANHAPLLTGLASDGTGPVAIAVDGATGALITSPLGGGSAVTGTLTNNNAAPSTNNLGVLSAVAATVAPSYTNGNLVALSTDLSGSLRVTGSLSVGGTTDNSAFTAGTSTGTPAMGFYHSTIDAVTDGRSAAVAITSKRAMMVNLQNASGTEIGTSTTPVQVSLANTAANSTAVKVDGSASTQPISGTVTANIGTSGSLALDATLTGGTQKTKLVDSGGTNVATISAAGAVKVDGSAVTQPVSGTVTANAGSGTFTVSGTVTANPGALPGTLVAFLTTITTAGTRVNLASNALSQGVVIEAPSTNTGVIYVGGSTVSSTAYGAELQPGQSTGLAVSNTNLVYVDTATNGNKVAVLGA